MQLQELLARTGCPQPTLKDWLRQGLIQPAQAGRGRGVHARYDEVNVLTIMLALEMKNAHIVVSRYVEAFATLDNLLRQRSSLEWPRYRVFLTPDHAVLIPRQQAASYHGPGFSDDLARYCAGWTAATDGEVAQLPLLGPGAL